MIEEHLYNSPYVVLKNIVIDRNQAHISGDAELYKVEYDSALSPIHYILIRKTSFSLVNNFLINFQDMLKTYSENLILEYILTANIRKAYIYDYHMRIEDLKQHPESTTYIGSSNGIYYEDQNMIEDQINKAGEK